MKKLSELLVGTSEVINTLKKKLKQVAAAGPGLNVMLIGATGTGKEVCAQAIHRGGILKEGNFEVLNCSGLNEQLFESFLFGHVKGAFSGASEQSDGLLGKIDSNHSIAAEKKEKFAGTLFLDELHDLPIATQGLLLRFLESGEYRRLGDMKTRNAKVRIIAALQPGDEMRSRLRDDLYSRLAEVEIHLPGLNERREDISKISEVLLERLFAEQPTPKCFFKNKLSDIDSERIAKVLNNEDFFTALENHDWSRGNVRELRSCLKRAALLNDMQLPAKKQPSEMDSMQVNAEGGLVSVTFNLSEVAKGDRRVEKLKTEYIRLVYKEMKKQNRNDVDIREYLGIEDARTLKKYLSGIAGKSKTFKKR